MGSSTLSAEDFFRLHRLALSNSEIGRVRQIITSQELVSEVDISTGIPSIPFAITGSVVTRATAARTNEGALKLTVKSTGVQVGRWVGGWVGEVEPQQLGRRRKDHLSTHPPTHPPTQSSSLFGFLGGGGNLPDLPLADLASRAGLSPPSVLMTTYYCDANMRISRTEDDHFFVFVRGHL